MLSALCPRVRCSRGKSLATWTGARLALLLPIALASACANLLPAASQKTTDTENAAAPGFEQQLESAAPEVNRPFEPETLFNLLVGELSVHNRDVRTAAEFYHREALRTREPQVIARAARLARYLNNPEMALELAELWYQVEPGNARAASNLADLYTRTGQLLRAVDVLEAQQRSGQQARFGILRNNDLQPGSDQMREVLARLNALSAGAGRDNFSLLFTHALLLQKNGDNAAALAQLQKLRGFDADPVQLAIIESQLQAELGDDAAATRVLRKALRKHPDDRNLKVAYARRLTKSDLPRAEKVFADLLAETPNDTTLLKSHGLIAAENGNFAAASQSLHTLLANNREKSFAHYNLGLIAEVEERNEDALKHYEQVRPGDYFLPATQNLVRLLAEREQLQQARYYLGTLRVNHPRHAVTFWKIESTLLRDREAYTEAREVLGLAIAQHPDNAELRFERSMIAEKLDDIEAVERDLRHVLAREPNNAMALNALGYILADRTTRFVEALDLIEKAIALKPGDPAIMDSLGWAQFRLGRYEEALANLQAAYRDFPDDEIAAHLIELHATMGDRRAALRVYKSIRQQSESHPLSDEVVQRLGLRP